MRLPVMVALAACALVAQAAAAPTISSAREHDATWASEVTWDVDFSVSRDQNAGVKLVAAPNNPAFNNGTPGVEGWWLEALMDRGAGMERLGVTNGKEAIDLGPQRAGVVTTLRLTLHIPDNATPAQHAVHMAVFSDPDDDRQTSGSGAILQPSETLTLRLTPNHALEEEAVATEAWPWLAPAIGGAAILLIMSIVTAVVLTRRH